MLSPSDRGFQLQWLTPLLVILLVDAAIVLWLSMFGPQVGSGLVLDGRPATLDQCYVSLGYTACADIAVIAQRTTLARLGFGCVAVALFLFLRRRVEPSLRPVAASLTAAGWIAVLVGGLETYYVLPWEVHPPVGWDLPVLGEAYRMRLPQIVAVVLAVVGLLDLPRRGEVGD